MKRVVRAVVLLAALGWSSVSHAQNPNDMVRGVLQVPQGCYPVGIDESNERIQNVCRGQAGWTPDGLQFFIQLNAGEGYVNKKNQTYSSLKQDMANQVGPVPWFVNWYLPILDARNIPRPR